jgi:hypothetical protein
MRLPSANARAIGGRLRQAESPIANNNKAKGRVGDASRFSFFISGCSLRRPATRDGGGPPFRTVDTTIRLRIPMFRTGVEPRLPIQDMARPADIPGSS